MATFGDILLPFYYHFWIVKSRSFIFKKIKIKFIVTKFLNVKNVPYHNFQLCCGRVFFSKISMLFDFGHFFCPFSKFKKTFPTKKERFFDFIYFRVNKLKLK